MSEGEIKKELAEEGGETQTKAQERWTLLFITVSTSASIKICGGK